jgi:hypothetical protein
MEAEASPGDGVLRRGAFRAGEVGPLYVAVVVGNPVWENEEHPASSHMSTVA